MQPIEHEGVFDSKAVWPDDADDLIELTDDQPTVEELGAPDYFDNLRAEVDRRLGF